LQQTKPAASPNQGDHFRPSGERATISADYSDRGITATGRFSAKDAVAAASQLLEKTAPPAVPQVDIKDVQASLTKALPDVQVDFLHTDAFGPLNGRLATAAELAVMIESLQDESKIPFGYIKDGCYARAHLMDESFRQHGINYAKMFVRGDLSAKNSHMEARWWYHVAPLVFMDDGEGNPQAKIIDPGFSDHPMDPNAWVKAMNQGPSIEVDLVDPEQYYPRRFNKPDSFSESLPPAVSRMQDYAQKLHAIRESAGQDLGDFVKPSWDTPGCGGDFVVDGETKTMFPDGVKSSPTRIYFGRTETNSNGTLVEIESPQVEMEVSAAWENRPSDFNPYAV
jgi:Glutaminase